MASDDSAEHQFVQWAKQAAAPICTLDPSARDTSNLQLLQQTVGDARVVVLSEAFHNCKEFIYLHHRVKDAEAGEILEWEERCERTLRRAFVKSVLPLLVSADGTGDSFSSGSTPPDLANATSHS